MRGKNNSQRPRKNFKDLQNVEELSLMTILKKLLRKSNSLEAKYKEIMVGCRLLHNVFVYFITTFEMNECLKYNGSQL